MLHSFVSRNLKKITRTERLGWLTNIAKLSLALSFIRKWAWLGIFMSREFFNPLFAKTVSFGCLKKPVVTHVGHNTVFETLRTTLEKSFGAVKGGTVSSR